MEINRHIEYFRNYSNYNQVDNIEVNGSPIKRVKGLYCILFVGDRNILPIWMKNWIEIEESEFLYLGQSNNLRKRIAQEIKGKKHGTFFRSIGAALGFTPLRGQLVNNVNKRNYWFDDEDKEKLVLWLNENIKIALIDCSELPDIDIKRMEKSLIGTLKTMINTDHNTRVPIELINSKKLCRVIANINDNMDFI